MDQRPMWRKTEIYKDKEVVVKDNHLSADNQDTFKVTKIALSDISNYEEVVIDHKKVNMINPILVIIRNLSDNSDSIFKYIDISNTSKVSAASIAGYETIDAWVISTKEENKVTRRKLKKFK
jgi:hypothetical protein